MNRQESRELELYLHIPFCVRKCLYCDFLSRPGNREEIREYAGLLAEEIRLWGQQLSREDYRVVSVFIGGGTPSCLAGEEILLLGQAWRESFVLESEAEITIEANPGMIDPGVERVWRQAGINRASLGLQSARNQELKTLGRIHTWEEFVESYQLLRRAGFDNINIDLMSGIPGQDLESLRETLQRTVELQPEHISAYSLILEEGTPFYQMEQEGKLETVSEEMDRRMYQYTKEYLQQQGYHRYEISNYARDGRECIHNCGYWQGREYLGLGLGASSFLQGYRFANPSEQEGYRKQLQCIARDDWKHSAFLSPERQSREALMEEFCFLGLRMKEGISRREFNRRFGVRFTEVYGDVADSLLEKKLLAEDAFHDRIYLTDRGIDVSNTVLAEFLL